MKHILFFNDSLVMGGTEVLLTDLLNHLAKKDCKITLLLPEPSGQDVLLNSLSPDISIKYIYKEGTSYLARKIGQNIMIFYPRLFARMKNINLSDYDEIVCFKETFYAKIFSKSKVHKILWIHNLLYKRTYEIRSFKERIAVWLNKIHIKKVQRSYRMFDKVICVSEAAKSAYISVIYDNCRPEQDIQVLHNAVDLSRVIGKSKEPIEDLPQGRTNFILITRDSPEKRTDRLINAATRLKEEGYDFHIYIIGEGMNREEMQSILHERQLNEFITLKDRIDNPFPYVLQCKWSLCVSERESFSLTLLESMALKTPIITTDCGGPRDIVDNGKYGLLVDNSAEGVYTGMKTVLDNLSLSVRYSADLDKAVARFDYQGWLGNVYKLLGIQDF